MTLRQWVIVQMLYRCALRVSELCNMRVRDIDLEDERKVLGDNYASWFARIVSLPTWTDTDQDDKVDEGEISSHEHIFENGW